MGIDGISAGTWRRRRFFSHVVLSLVLCAAALLPKLAYSQAPLFLGVTTSTENSGLLAHLVDAFEADHDVQIRAVTAGSGAVLNLAARGDVDIILVHSPEDEAAFIASGFGIDRRPVMENRFVIVGPKSDPAGVGTAGDVTKALEAIAAKRALFLSRGDESGTHKAELRLWQHAGIDPADMAGWYRESGSGQGATLNIAANTDAYMLTDEATWATFGNPGNLEVLHAGDEPALHNVYSIIRVNPERYPGLNAEDALIFSDWLASKAGQEAITSFRAGDHQLFRPVTGLSG